VRTPAIQAHRFKRPLSTGVALLLFVLTVPAQEALRPSLAKQRSSQPSTTGDYNLKIGPVLLNFATGTRVEFIDNVGLSNGTTVPKESDLQIGTSLDIAARWQLTKLNTLQFRTTVGQTRYLAHPELNTSNLLFSPDSELSFDVFVGDFKINFHDRFSYQQDPSGEGGVSNTSRLGRFTNVVGISGLSDLNDLTLSLGYDHTTLTVSDQTGPAAQGSTATTNRLASGSLDRATDQVSAMALLHFSDTFSAGLESTASSTTYKQSSQNDSTRFTIGPFAAVQLTSHTKLSFSAGLMSIQSQSQTVFGATSLPVQTVLNPDGTPDPTTRLTTQQISGASGHIYGSINITHRLNSFYSDQLSIGRESMPGIFSQETQTDFARYRSTWLLTPNIRLSSTFFYERVQETSSQLSNSSYERIGATFETGYKLTRHLGTSIAYQYLQKKTENAIYDYTQNRITLSLNYQF